jgi:hypothetical protein
MSNNLPAVLHDGVWRVLGCIPSSEESASAFPWFSENFRSAAPEPLKPIDLGFYKNTIYDQSNTSSCAGHSAASSMGLGFLQSGRPKTDFSPFFVYGLVNGGRDNGAMISDCLKVLMQYGVCKRSTVPSGVMYKNQFTQNMFDEAKRFKLTKAFRCATFEDICAAINLGFPTPLGIYVGNNFANLDSEGVAPLPNFGGGGHAILGCGLKYSDKYGWCIKIQNSWGSNFGMKGFAYIHKGHFSRMNPDAFAVQVILDQDPLDDTPEDEIPVNPDQN